MPIDMSLLKDFRCILTVPKGVLVRELHEDGSWRIVRSPERLQVLYRSSAADKVSAEAALLTCKVLAAAASKDGQNKFSRMMLLVEQLLLRLTTCLILVVTIVLG